MGIHRFGGDAKDRLSTAKGGSPFPTRRGRKDSSIESQFDSLRRLSVACGKCLDILFETIHLSSRTCLRRGKERGEVYFTTGLRVHGQQGEGRLTIYSLSELGEEGGRGLLNFGKVNAFAVRGEITSRYQTKEGKRRMWLPGPMERKSVFHPSVRRRAIERVPHCKRGREGGEKDISNYGGNNPSPQDKANYGVRRRELTKSSDHLTLSQLFREGEEREREGKGGKI